MQMIDTHSHLYLSQFDHDRNEMMERAKKAGVEAVYLPAIDSNTHDAMLDMEADYPDICFAMMGLHPCSVNEQFPEELLWVEHWLQKRKFVAIGEIGLDFYWDTTYEKHQYEAFRIQIEWSILYKLPIVIHTRKATQEAVNVVNEYKGRGLRGIFHCFGDDYSLAKQIMDAGFLLGVGGVVTYKNSGLANTLKQVPLDYIVLETDAPYLSPVPFRGKRNESSYLQYIASTLAQTYDCTVEEINKATSVNARNLFHK